jgi:hypothetical protein
VQTGMVCTIDDSAHHEESPRGTVARMRKIRKRG